MKNLDIFLIFVTVRIASVLLVQTFFVPDEYWQSLEVAHKLVFDYGYLTWEWTMGIRSYIYPMLIAAFYQILAIIRLDTPVNLIYGPRILQALLSAYADLCFYKWSGTRKWAVFCIATSWFWFYTGSRTLINTFECALTTIALSQFPWPGKTCQHNTTFLFIVALLCVTRPTAIIVWMPICLYHVLLFREQAFSLLLTRYLPIGLSILGGSVLLDSWAHGSFVVTMYEFLKFNVMEDVGSWYGTHPWHWNLSIGLPAILGIQFVPFVLATFVVLKNRHIHQNELVLLGTILFTIITYSALPHKEFRFLLPVLPVVLYISSRFLSAWSRKASNFSVWLVAGIIFIGNLIPAWYLGVVHQSGTLAVMSPLRDIAQKNPENTYLLFLMPCHSTPLYSHLHVNVTMKFLSCQPNFNKSVHYVDEADQFYDNPHGWLRKHYPPNGTLPSHIVCFDSLLPMISDIMSRYKQISSIFHTSIPTSRTGRYVLINERLDF